MTKGAYVAAVETAQEAIRSGEVYQLVLSNLFTGDCDIPPIDVYRALRLLDPSPYMFLLELGDTTVVGASPEALVRVEDDEVFVQPIAGTRPRGSERELDLLLERELLADAKEAAEHVMLVDLARNDVGQVATCGTVRVDPLRQVRRYRNVMHLVSGVSGAIVDPKSRRPSVRARIEKASGPNSST